MPEIAGPAGRLHYVVTGDDEPVTVFAPGLAQSIADTRAFGSAVSGTRVFVDLRGHGGSAAPTTDAEWSYDALAEDVGCVADALGATRALGVSLGAGAVIAMLAAEPRRFERVVLALPGALTSVRSSDELAVTDELADAIDSGASADPARTASALLAMQPVTVRRRADVRLWARRHAAELAGRADTARAVRAFPRQHVLPSLDALRDVAAHVLVLAQRDDAIHPLAAAEQLSAALPNSTLIVSDVAWVWGARTQLRQVVSDFLNTRL